MNRRRHQRRPISSPITMDRPTRHITTQRKGPRQGEERTPREHIYSRPHAHEKIPEKSVQPETDLQTHTWLAKKELVKAVEIRSNPVKEVEGKTDLERSRKTCSRKQTRTRGTAGTIQKKRSNLHAEVAPCRSNSNKCKFLEAVKKNSKKTQGNESLRVLEYGYIYTY